MIKKPTINTFAESISAKKEQKYGVINDSLSIYFFLVFVGMFAFCVLSYFYLFVFSFSSVLLFCACRSLEIF